MLGRVVVENTVRDVFIYGFYPGEDVHGVIKSILFLRCAPFPESYLWILLRIHENVEVQCNVNGS
mgnify:CR=1 FL=1